MGAFWPPFNITKAMKNYWKLWSLLGVAFAIFLVVSVLDVEMTIAGVPIRSSQLGHVFRQSQLRAEEADSIDLDALIDSIDAGIVEIDTVPKTILFIGDSMLEGLSPRLAAYCEASGHTLYTVIWYSSTTEVWGSSGRLSQYISELNPGYVIICLGANELFVSDIARKRDKHVKTLLSEIGDIPYLWIGPPNWKADTGINDLIAANVPAGNFFVSNGMEFKRKKDGAHPTAESAIVWMDSVARWMPLHSNHPITLNPPDKKTSRPTRVFIHQPQK